jgi:hypothetical protein
LIDYAPDDIPRVLINLERVGELASEEDEDYESGMFSRFNESGFDFKGLSRGGREVSFFICP